MTKTYFLASSPLSLLSSLLLFISSLSFFLLFPFSKPYISKISVKLLLAPWQRLHPREQDSPQKLWSSNHWTKLQLQPATEQHLLGEGWSSDFYSFGRVFHLVYLQLYLSLPFLCDSVHKRVNSGILAFSQVFSEHACKCEHPCGPYDSCSAFECWVESLTLPCESLTRTFREMGHESWVFRNGVIALT